jgi:hypothetical protein
MCGAGVFDVQVYGCYQHTKFVVYSGAGPKDCGQRLCTRCFEAEFTAGPAMSHRQVSAAARKPAYVDLIRLKDEFAQACYDHKEYTEHMELVAVQTERCDWQRL